MGQAVQESAGEPLGAEDLCPLVEGQVGGDEDRSSLVALAEDLEQQLCAGLGQRDEAEFVDDEELEAGELLLEIEQASLVFGLYQLIGSRSVSLVSGPTALSTRSLPSDCLFSVPGNSCHVCWVGFSEQVTPRAPRKTGVRDRLGTF